MKFKYLFTILFCLVLFSSEIFACSLGKESSFIQEKQAEANNLITISFVLFAITFFLFFKKNKKGILPVVISSIVVVYAYLLSDANIGDCGYGAVDIARLSVLVNFICFSFQFFTWLFRRKSAKAELP
jgi:hypothetical protein